MVVHFHKATGRISAWGNGDSESSHFADHDIVRFDDDAMIIDPHRDKIDVESLALVARDTDEMLEDMRPEIVAAIAAELAATDGYMVPDRPLTDQQRGAWKDYRQALRDIKGDAEAMLDAWPVRPDRTDAAAGFISRLREIKLHFPSISPARYR